MTMIFACKDYIKYPGTSILFSLGDSLSEMSHKHEIGSQLSGSYGCKLKRRSVYRCISSVSGHLTFQIGNQWIGRGGPKTWHMRLPDLTPPIFKCMGAIRRTWCMNAKQSEEKKQSIDVSVLQDA